MNEISKKIKKAMIDAEIGREQLAEMVGVSPSTIWRIETGVTKEIKASLYNKIQKALKMKEDGNKESSGMEKILIKRLEEAYRQIGQLEATIEQLTGVKGKDLKK